MKIWALADLHLPFGDPGKSMEIFGPQWEGYTEKIKANWCALVGPDDLVLVAGDISWAMKPEQAIADLEWIDSLPGKKVMIRGNHDYWWGSAAKVRKILPESIEIVQNDVFNWNGVTIGGSRLWDTFEYNFNPYIHFRKNPKERKSPKPNADEMERIFVRELERLKMSLKQLDPQADLRIAMTHYPPISADLKPSRASEILEEFGVQICVFGHLHNLKEEPELFGEVRGVRYICTSADYIHFIPVQIA